MQIAARRALSSWRFPGESPSPKYGNARKRLDEVIREFANADDSKSCGRNWLFARDLQGPHHATNQRRYQTCTDRCWLPERTDTDVSQLVAALLLSPVICCSAWICR
jgi:hypothetical protein